MCDHHTSGVFSLSFSPSYVLIVVCAQSAFETVLQRNGGLRINDGFKRQLMALELKLRNGEQSLNFFNTRTYFCCFFSFWITFVAYAVRVYICTYILHAQAHPCIRIHSHAHAQGREALEPNPCNSLSVSANISMFVFILFSAFVFTVGAREANMCVGVCRPCGA